MHNNQEIAKKDNALEKTGDLRGSIVITDKSVAKKVDKKTIIVEDGVTGREYKLKQANPKNLDFYECNKKNELYQLDDWLNTINGLID